MRKTRFRIIATLNTHIKSSSTACISDVDVKFGGLFVGRIPSAIQNESFIFLFTLYVYMHVCMYVCMQVYMYMNIYSYICSNEECI